MGLFDKLKNIFIEEEEIEEEIPIVKRVEKTEPIIKEIKQEAVTAVENPVPNKVISDRELTDTNQKFKFPIIFEDDDFKEEKRANKSINVLERENTKYEPEIKRDVRPQKKVFKPSLVISPVYGVLDKNYSKNDITTKDGLLSDSSEIDIDSVIKKAYGDEVEITSRQSKNRNIIKEETVVLLDEEKEEPVVEEVSIEAEVPEEKTNLSEVEIDEKIKSIDELLKDTSDDDFYSLVDSMYKDEEEEDKE